MTVPLSLWSNRIVNKRSYLSLYELKSDHTFFTIQHMVSVHTALTESSCVCEEE